MIPVRHLTNPISSPFASLWSFEEQQSIASLVSPQCCVSVRGKSPVSACSMYFIEIHCVEYQPFGGCRRGGRGGGGERCVNRCGAGYSRYLVSQREEARGGWDRWEGTARSGNLNFSIRGSLISSTTISPVFEGHHDRLPVDASNLSTFH